MRTTSFDLVDAVESISKSYEGHAVSRWDLWGIFDTNTPVLWKDIYGHSYLVWLNKGTISLCARSHRWLNAAFGFEAPRSGSDIVAFHRAVVITDPISIADSDIRFYTVVFTTGDDIEAEIGRHKAERLNVKVTSSDGGVSWVTCFSLLGTARASFVKPFSQVNDMDGRSNVVRKIREFLLLSDPTWGWNYPKLRTLCDFQYGECVVIEGAKPFPAVVVGDVAVSGLMGKKGALLVLRLVDYHDWHEEEPHFRPVDVELHGKPLSVALPLILPVPLAAAGKWPEEHNTLDNFAIKAIQTAWRTYLA